MSSVNPAEKFRLMERRVEEAQKRLTLGEAAAGTGMSLDEAETALRDMIARYDCRLQVTENGDIIYDFGDRLHRRDEKSFQEYLDDALALLWKGFVFLFKAWIAVTLVVYFTIFLVIFVAIIVALVFGGESKDGDSRGRSSRSDSGLGDLFFGIFRVFLAIFEWNAVTSTVYYETDSRGYRYQTYKPKPTPLQKKEDSKSFIASVYDFVFGPPRVERDPLENQKEAAAYLRRNKGILVPSELKALSGMDSNRAALFFSDCIGRFQGDIRISENKIMYGRFDRLLRTAGDADDGKIVFYWDEYEPPYPLTGNTTGMNWGIGILNGFNLIFSLLILGGALGEQFSAVWLGFIPFLFSLIFFAVPALRSIKLASDRSRRDAENRRKRVMKAIFLTRGTGQTVEQILRAVNAPGAPEPLSKETVESILDTLIKELPGEIRADATGQVFYEFPIITFELEEAERLRAQRTVDRDLGKVVFDSNQE